MPNRMLRDWTESDKINMISVHAERFFLRLIMKVDDYGCFHADPRLLKANLFPLLLDGMREADISRWTAECEKAGLIVLYEANSKSYLEIIDFNQRKRAMHRKYPVRQANDGQVTDIRPLEVEGKKEEEENKGAHDISKSNLFRQPVIPTKQDVLEVFSRAGGTKEMANSFYEKYEGTGWYLNGSPIINFTSLAQRFITSWKSNDEKKPGKDRDLPAHMQTSGGPKLPKL